jgi:RHS repeat-associated protein
VLGEKGRTHRKGRDGCATSVYYDGAYAPYGESYAESGTTDHFFTGQEQDVAPSGEYPLYDFLAREYNPTWGRWISPDPMGGNVLNPQSLNRYAYVDNNPLSFTDPLGLDSSNPADPCSGTGWESDALCAGPTTQCAPGDIECQLYYLNGPLGIAGGGGGGSTGGGGGGAVSSAPPAGQPPLAGGATALTPYPDPGIIWGPWTFKVSTWAVVYWPCALGLAPCVRAAADQGLPQPNAPTVETQPVPTKSPNPPSGDLGVPSSRGCKTCDAACVGKRNAAMATCMDGAYFGRTFGRCARAANSVYVHCEEDICSPSYCSGDKSRAPGFPY